MLRDFGREKFDIIVQAGQSNSDGTGFGNAQNPFKLDYRVWYLTGDWQVPNDFHFEPAREIIYDNLICSNFSLSFARKYIEDGRLEEGRKALIIRAAVGGTGFLDGNWKPQDPLFVRMMAMIKTALELNPENRLTAALWHQGETDASLNASYDVHYNHLMTFIKLIRETYDAPNLPFIAGDFVRQWSEMNAGIVAPVIKAMRAVCADAGSAAFVETDGLLSNDQDPAGNPCRGDTIHFCRQALYELGERYYEAFVGITGK